MTNDIKSEFWDRLKDTRSGMLSADGAPAVPMTHYVDDSDGGQSLWFITAKDTDLGKASVSPVDAQYLISSKDEQLYARIDGRLVRSEESAQLDRIWNSFAAAWFEDGREDSDVQLLRFDLTEAEVWITGGSLKFLFEVAKANATDSTPDIGSHATLSF